MVAGPRKGSGLGIQSAFPVRSYPVLDVLAGTWQSHVALQVVKIWGYRSTTKVVPIAGLADSALRARCFPWDQGVGAWNRATRIKCFS
jgi:hypothetical protein